MAYVEKYLYLMRVADPESESDSADIRRFTGMKTSWLFSLTLEILGCSMVKMKVIRKLGFVAQRTQQYKLLNFRYKLQSYVSTISFSGTPWLQPIQ